MAWRARELAVKSMRGQAEESYAELAPFLHTVKKTNLGIVTDIVYDTDGKFRYMFMVLAASIKGWEHCRPVIVVDGTFLKCKHGGSLLCACAEDAENQIFPLAFGTGD